MASKRPERSPENRLKAFCLQWKLAGLSGNMQIVRQIPAQMTNLTEGPPGSQELEPISRRVDQLLAILTEQFRTKTKPTTMFFWVMYDISNNKVRTQVAKYLKKKGCLRMQKSVFVGNMSFVEYEKLVATLRHVQSLYENEDSIVVAPLDHDHLKGLNVIGAEVDLHLFRDPRSTLFF
jgi:CRISPR-associated protein Cas2